MSLAPDPIRVRIGGTAHELRPTLRAALALVRRHDDLVTLARAIDGGSVTACRDVLAYAAPDAPDLFTILDGARLADALASLKGPMLRFVLALTTPAADEDKAPAKDEAPITFTARFERLFALGTGALGWSPRETWDASPAEIVAAYKGRCELLSLIFGGGSTKGKAKDRSGLTLDQKAALTLANLRDRQAAKATPNA